MSRGLDTSAQTVIALRPDWRRPLDWLGAFTRYVAAGTGLGDVCLCLDATESGVPVEAVREMVTTAYTAAAEDGESAEVLLLEEPVDLAAAGAVRLGSPAALAEHLELPAPVPAASDAGVVAHARWAKELADALQAQLDAALYAAAREPAPHDDLVTVRIPTYGSVEALMERTLPSVLNGDYARLEVLVCSDGPQPHARAAVEAVGDPRVRYLEVPERTAYASFPTAFWQTAGTSAQNRMLDEARGAFITPLDHDDAFTRDHVSALVAGVRSGSDFVYGQGVMELSDRTWTIVGSDTLAHGRIVHGSVLYSRRLGHMRYDPHCWLIDEPGDWNLWRRIAQAGARVGHLPRPVVLHFEEGSMMADDSRRLRAPTQAELAADVAGTAARDLLGIASRSRRAVAAG